MWGIDAGIILVFIPIVFVGIIVVAAIGAKEEKTWGDRFARFFGIASNAAIFFTVLALLYQVIYSEEESRRASYSDLLNTYYEINQMQMDNPEVWAMLYPNEPEMVNLTEDERLAVQYTYFLMNFFERLYLLYRDGVIDDELWTSWEIWIGYSLSTSAMFQQVWDESCGMHHPEFIDYVETSYDDGACPIIGDPISEILATPAAASN
jgi:hypothetical protein